MKAIINTLEFAKFVHAIFYLKQVVLTCLEKPKSFDSLD